DDTAITEQDTPLTVSALGVLGNDFDDYWGELTAELVSEPENGSLLLDADGSFIYTPDEGFYGEDWFSYRAFDGRAYSEEATVEITVNAIPVAEDDTAITEQDTPLTVSAMGVLDNDFDDYWGELTAELVSDPENGSLVLGADGSFTYTPDEGFYGEDWFSYRAFDGRAYSEEATVTITVSNSVSPIAYDDEYFVDAGQFLVIRKPGPLGNDVNPSGEPLRMAVIQQPSNFAFFGWTELGQFSYQPRPGFEGIDTFTYQASGDGFISQIATVRITVTAAGPTLRFSGCNHAAIRDASAALCGLKDLRSIHDAAIAEWTRAGVRENFAKALSEVKLRVWDLPGDELARVANRTVYLDHTAAGHGWFWNAAPGAEKAFVDSATEREMRAIDPRAVDRIDLLTVLMHEFGHIAGLPDDEPSSGGLMSESLGEGLRRLPGKQEIDLILADGRWSD
ncbi:MAG: tandem-95 repeat protein, partial [Rhodopirellula sp.]|nr:tandem-95 repeat protein [Rhodopirellula sp.]